MTLNRQENELNVAFLREVQLKSRSLITEQQAPAIHGTIIGNKLKARSTEKIWSVQEKLDALNLQLLQQQKIESKLDCAFASFAGE
jgi:hypothetical protein